MKTILIVDDEFDLTGTLRCILEEEGYRAAICSNGKEALDRLRSLRPDLVLMDVMMPALSGFEVLRSMRQTPALRTVPVVLMSAAPPGVKREGYDWQAFLCKPFTIETLVRTVNGILGKTEPVPG
jgi:DNA-binding response OmpR family regulator